MAKGIIAGKIMGKLLQSSQAPFRPKTGVEPFHHPAVDHWQNNIQCVLIQTFTEPYFSSQWKIGYFTGRGNNPSNRVHLIHQATPTPDVPYLGSGAAKIEINGIGSEPVQRFHCRDDLFETGH